MNVIGAPPLAWLGALREPTECLQWSLPQWEQTLRLSRRLRLLPRLATAVQQAGLGDALPPQVQRQLLAAQRLSQSRTQTLRWTLERVGQALQSLDAPRVLLKGAAYIGQGLPIADGRLPSDLDMLVPKSHVNAAQRLLLAQGWQEVMLDAHDQRFYREWSHELPPMHHVVLPMELDLHHNILPPVARLRVDMQPLLERLQPSALPGWQVLHPLDQVLHSAAHLFQDSEIRDRMRDLVDLDGLLRHFGSRQPDFWQALPARAAELGLSEPLALACRFCSGWLGTPMPAELQQVLRSQGPGPVRRAWLLPLLRTLLRPAPVDGPAPWQQGAAAWIFLLRHHRNRLPLPLLLPHLWHKLRVQRQAADAQTPPQTAEPPPA